MESKLQKDHFFGKKSFLFDFLNYFFSTSSPLKGLARAYLFEAY